MKELNKPRIINCIVLKLQKMSHKKRKNIIKVMLPIFTFIILGAVILYISRQRIQKNSLNQTEKISQTLSEERPSDIEGLPADFPVYENSEFVTFAVSDDKKGKSYIWKSDDETGLIFEYLKSELRIKGWILKNDSSVGSSSTISFEKKGVSGFLGVFDGSSGESIVSVTIRTD